jgi:hypothetical protein
VVSLRQASDVGDDPVAGLVDDETLRLVGSMCRLHDEVLAWQI